MMDVVADPTVIVQRTIAISLTILAFGFVAIGGLLSLRRFAGQKMVAVAWPPLSSGFRESDPPQIQNLKTLLRLARTSLDSSEESVIDLNNVPRERSAALQPMLDDLVSRGLATASRDWGIYRLSDSVLGEIERQVVAYKRDDQARRDADDTPAGPFDSANRDDAGSSSQGETDDLARRKARTR